MKKILLVGDGGDSPVLESVMLEQGLVLTRTTKSISVKNQWLIRHSNYVWLALQAIRNRSKHDGVFIWQQYVALYYLLMTKVYPVSSKKVFIFYILFKTSKNSFFNRIKINVFLMLLESNAVKKAFFLSSKDALYPYMSDSKKEIVPLAKQESKYIEKYYQKGLNLEVDDYFFSGGSSNRNYEDLIELAYINPALKIKIALKEDVKNKFKSVPKNVEMIINAYNDAFECLILQSKAVIIPIINIKVLSGQLVCLQAMQAGKAIFITKNDFIEEWLKDSIVNEFIMQYKNADDLSEMILKCTNADLYNKGVKAREFFNKNCSSYVMYKRLAYSVSKNLYL